MRRVHFSTVKKNKMIKTVHSDKMKILILNANDIKMFPSKNCFPMKKTQHKPYDIPFDTVKSSFLFLVLYYFLN